jgi:hypothetical protein
MKNIRKKSGDSGQHERSPGPTEFSSIRPSTTAALVGKRAFAGFSTARQGPFKGISSYELLSYNISPQLFYALTAKPSLDEDTMKKRDMEVSSILLGDNSPAKGAGFRLSSLALASMLHENYAQVLDLLAGFVRGMGWQVADPFFLYFAGATALHGKRAISSSSDIKAVYADYKKAFKKALGAAGSVKENSLPLAIEMSFLLYVTDGIAPADAMPEVVEYLKSKGHDVEKKEKGKA